MKRREFITLLGGAAAAWPLAAHAQQPAMPVIAFINARSTTRRAPGSLRSARACAKPAMSRAESSDRVPLGRGPYDRLPRWRLISSAVGWPSSPRLAAPPAALAAKAATTTIPIVFGVGEDPVRLGLVTSLGAAGWQRDRRQFFHG